jgi:hypothetical protein
MTIFFLNPSRKSPDQTLRHSSISLFQYERFRGSPTYVYLNLPLYLCGFGMGYACAFAGRGGYVRFEVFLI